MCFDHSDTLSVLIFKKTKNTTHIDIIHQSKYNSLIYGIP